MNTVKNIDEVDQIILLTTSTTKLHIHFLDFHNKKIPKIQTPLLLTPPFITIARVGFNHGRQRHLSCISSSTIS